jgi:Raf kinase inhibitor-like YbhB/YbcL family protein
MSLTISSSAFAPQGPIPREFTRYDANVSPPVEWHDAPAETRSFALIVEDPDAPDGIFHHWVAYDIPASSTNLKEGEGSREAVTMLRMGRNDFGNTRYDGPQPPAGHGAHHYHFRLLALKVSELDVPAQSAAEVILEAAKAQCLAEAEIVGVCQNPGGPSKGTETPPGSVRHGIADTDKLARTGSVKEPVRDTPPAGAWNDVAPNE